MPLSLQKIMRAKAPDVMLQDEDIVFVPESKVKAPLGPPNIASAALGTATHHRVVICPEGEIELADVADIRVTVRAFGLFPP